MFHNADGLLQKTMEIVSLIAFKGIEWLLLPVCFIFKNLFSGKKKKRVYENTFL